MSHLPRIPEPLSPTPWEEAQRTFAETEIILELKALYQQRPGRTAAEALGMAVETWEREQAAKKQG